MRRFATTSRRVAPRADDSVVTRRDAVSTRDNYRIFFNAAGDSWGFSSSDNRRDYSKSDWCDCCSVAAVYVDSRHMGDATDRGDATIRRI